MMAKIKVFYITFCTINCFYGQQNELTHLYIECLPKNHLSFLIRGTGKSTDINFIVPRETKLCTFEFQKRKRFINSCPQIKYKVKRKAISVNIELKNSFERLVDTLIVTSKRDTVEWILDYQKCNRTIYVNSVEDVNSPSNEYQVNDLERAYFIIQQHPDRIYYSVNKKMISYFFRVL